MRVAHYLLGRRCLDDALNAFARLVLPNTALDELILDPSMVDALLRRLDQWLPEAARKRREHKASSALSIHLRGGSGLGKSALVRALARQLGMAVIECDCSLLQAQDPQSAAEDLLELLHAGVLLGALVAFDRIDLLLPGGPVLAALRRGLDSISAVVFLLGEAELSENTGLPWRSLVDLQLNPPDADEREAIWMRELQHASLHEDVEAGLLANQYPLSGAQIRNAARDAILKSENGRLNLEALSDSASDQLRADLSEYARPRATKLGLDDLVLPPTEKESIREIITACKQRATVLHKWGLRRRLAYGTGIVALFAGEPGTGKTLSSQIIAEAVGMSLYQIAIPSIVSKWIGETERNISLIFRRARASKAILLLDEADSLLATRTEVKDSTDRYANMSTNQLLQEIEAFEGVVILTSNREQNLDPAAERRILFRVHFPFPGPDERAELWRRLLPLEARPKQSKIDFEYLGELYELSGGHIKNVIMRAAYAAMDAGQELGTELLSQAAEKECRAIGKLIKRTW
jgi:SpoVK/Ycf46/Vps4 family AAA+-type ATPase